jgi:LysM repeat protein
LGVPVAGNEVVSAQHGNANEVTAPLHGLVFALVFGAPALGAPPASAERAAARTRALIAPLESTPRGRLFQLLIAGATESVPRPTSPRYLALERAGMRGFGLYLGWSLPGLSSEDERVLEAVQKTLGGDDGWLAARIVRAKKADSVNVWLERVENSAWFGVEVTGGARSPTKNIELMVLETLAVLAAHAPPAVEGANGATAAEPSTDPAEAAGLSPALVGRVVRRLLPASSRAVVEIQPPDPPDVARVHKVPVRHVVERGDTLTHIAQKNGLDLDALVRLNGIDPDAPIHPGDELRVSDKRARRPKLYVVKPGDTLAKVAKRFGVSEARLREVNRLTVRRVQTGQKLVLPQ